MVLALGLFESNTSPATTTRDLGELVALGAPAPVLIEQDMYAEDAAKRIADAAMAGLGQVDILVNNAGGSRSFKDINANAIKYVRRIEELIGAPVALLSTSPERDDTILMRDPFQG